MNLDKQVTPEVYFDIRLPSRICLLIIVFLGLAVVVALAWFSFKTEDYVIKTTTYQRLEMVRD